MSTMTKKLLQERLAAAESTLELARSELSAVLVARADSQGDDEHDPEGSTLSSDWSRNAGMATAAEAHLAAVTRAVDRFDLGAYGFCVRCGHPIAAARLEAIPEAELCISCASQTR